MTKDPINCAKCGRELCGDNHTSHVVITYPLSKRRYRIIICKPCFPAELMYPIYAAKAKEEKAKCVNMPSMAPPRTRRTT